MRKKKVYLFRGNDGMYKIGTSYHPKKRIKQVQTGNSDQLELIHEYESSNALLIETTLHNIYVYGRKKGEWFDMSIIEEVHFLEYCERINDSINALRLMGNPYLQ
jgi:hypothetical protein